MAVQVKLSGVKQLSNTSLTSIVEFTNFNVNLIASAVQDFLRSINYVEGQDEVSVEIASIDSVKPSLIFILVKTKNLSSFEIRPGFFSSAPLVHMSTGPTFAACILYNSVPIGTINGKG